MKKIVRLTESDLLNIVKRVIKESTMGEEPISRGLALRLPFLFGEGQTSFPSDVAKKAKEQIKNQLKKSNTLKVIQKFYKDPSITIPKIINVKVGTSSTGTNATNREVGQRRMNYLIKIIQESLTELGVQPDMAYSLISQQNTVYKPSSLDKNFFNNEVIPPKSYERAGVIEVLPLEIQGLNPNKMGELQGKLIDASSIINTWLVDNVDEDSIISGIKKLQTYSDITDLNKSLKNARMGDLETFLNNQLFDDYSYKQDIVSHLNFASENSEKGQIAKMVGDKISIMI
jgi:hypothetical protein